jgi:type IV pilus assembly protein PilC
MSIDNQSLKQFAGSMAKCLAAALPVSQALELSGARTPSRPLRTAVAAARTRCEDGLPVSEALAPGAALFPRHFLPVLRAGEAAGKQAEAFQLLYRHCQRIGPSLRVVRNTWLYPLICIVFGWIIRVGIFIYFGRYHSAVNFAVTAFGLSAFLVLTGWLLCRLPPVKRAIDFLLLQIPVLRETELRLGFVLYFSTFRLAYEGGGLDVVQIFDLALATVRNETIRRDLRPAREILAANGPIGEAFEECSLLDHETKGLIHTGSLSGQLDQCLNKIVEKAAWQLELTLRIFNQFFQRLVVFCVVMSIVETVLMCIL